MSRCRSGERGRGSDADIEDIVGCVSVSRCGCGGGISVEWIVRGGWGVRVVVMVVVVRGVLLAVLAVVSVLRTVVPAYHRCDFLCKIQMSLLVPEEIFAQNLVPVPVRNVEGSVVGVVEMAVGVGSGRRGRRRRRRVERGGEEHEGRNSVAGRGWEGTVGLTNYHLVL